MARRRSARLLVATVALLSGCGGPAPDPDPEPRNLLLLTVDTLRADHLSWSGYRPVTSPNLDQLAAEGVRFENAIVQRGGTWPSLTSILTSMYPKTHGVRSNGDMLDTSIQTIAELLKRHDFRTQAMITNMLQATHRGFDEVILFGDSAAGGRDAAAANAAIGWLRRAPEERFFLWLHLLGPHDPYLPATESAPQFASGYTGPLDGSREVLQQIHAEHRALSPAELRHIISLYDSDIHEVDAHLGRVLAALRETGLDRDTLVVFTSDHGEELYDHDAYFLHSWSIYDSVLRVPLLFVLPSSLPDRRVVENVVESIDIAPTVFELLALPLPEKFEGTSLAPLLHGGATAGSAAGAAFSELGPYLESIRTKRWRYIYNPRELSSPGSRREDSGREGVFAIEREELYDLATDPRERHNVVNEHPEVAAELRRRVLQWRGSEPDAYRAQDLAPEVREELRALGYVD